ncbi:hypothetical protein [Streptomyces sp. NPDC060194]|uniref:hypothetical protein n=1 Tax=Streptomyces sp. NPDC060194 TaxID=3347069 RepID=UPI00365F6E46
MTEDTPRTPDGAKLCAWCGGAIRQSGVGRSRDYCSRTHKEYAYRSRREARLIAEALAAQAAVSTTGESAVSTTVGTPDAPVSPVVETASRPVKRGKRPTAAPPSMSLPTEWRAVPPARPALPLPTEPRSPGRRQLTPPIRQEPAPTLFDEGTGPNPQVDG